MSTPFVVAVPSKGRLQENAEAFFAQADASNYGSNFANKVAVKCP